MTALDVLLPRTANNGYGGGRVPLYFFYALTAMVTFRSLVHFVKDDSGVNSIASILVFSGTPDPNNVVYMFSALWGSQQVIMLMVYLIVLLRYRNLIPLMWTLMVVEVFFRLAVGAMHPLTPEYYEHTPPAMLARVPVLVFNAVMLFLAVRRTAAETTGAPPPG